MLYGNLSWPYDFDQHYCCINMGDILQVMTIDRIYQKMGIDTQVHRISMKDIKTYKGEKLLLPLNWSLFDPLWMQDDKVSISQDVEPLFLAVTMGVGHQDKWFNAYNIAYLKAHEPIGCRDEATKVKLQHFGIQAYLNGCLTCCFPKIKSHGEKIYFVDVPVGVEDYIPDSLKEKSVFLSQQYYMQKGGTQEDVLAKIKQRYIEYSRDVKMVVTSRLHVASPCMAMSIPVIFVKDQIDERFSWIDKLLPLYNAQEYSYINWNPAPCEYEHIKDQMQQCAIDRIIGRCCINLQNEIDQWWSQRNKRTYVDFRECLYDFSELLDRWISQRDYTNSGVSYSIWGLTKNSERIFMHMSRMYPQMHLKYVVDSFKTGSAFGKRIKKPCELHIGPNDIVLVLAVGAVEQAQNMIHAGCLYKKQCCFLASAFLRGISDRA